MTTRSIIYRKWFPVPTQIIEHVSKLSAPELRLYLVLLGRGRGRARSVAVTNRDLKKLAALDGESLPKARNGLIKHELVTAEKSGKESYRYEILEVMPDEADESVSSGLPIYSPAVKAAPIPFERLWGQPVRATVPGATTAKPESSFPHVLIKW